MIDFVDNLKTIHVKQHKRIEDISNENGLGSALQSGCNVLQGIGGKMIIFSHGLASVGLGKLKNREKEIFLYLLSEN